MRLKGFLLLALWVMRIEGLRICDDKKGGGALGGRGVCVFKGGMI